MYGTAIKLFREEKSDLNLIKPPGSTYKSSEIQRIEEHVGKNMEILLAKIWNMGTSIQI